MHDPQERRLSNVLFVCVVLRSQFRGQSTVDRPQEAAAVRRDQNHHVTDQAHRALHPDQSQGGPVQRGRLAHQRLRPLLLQRVSDRALCNTYLAVRENRTCSCVKDISCAWKGMCAGCEREIGESCTHRGDAINQSLFGGGVCALRFLLRRTPFWMRYYTRRAWLRLTSATQKKCLPSQCVNLLHTCDFFALFEHVCIICGSCFLITKKHTKW